MYNFKLEFQHRKLTMKANKLDTESLAEQSQAPTSSTILLLMNTDFTPKTDSSSFWQQCGDFINVRWLNRLGYKNNTAGNCMWFVGTVMHSTTVVTIMI